MMALCAGQGPMVLAACLLAIGLLGVSYLCPRDMNFKASKSKMIFSVCCIAAIMFLGMPSGGEFIYFQF